MKGFVLKNRLRLKILCIARMKKKIRIRKKRIEIISTLPRRIIKAIFLIMPAVISFVWLTYLKLTDKTIVISKAGLMLAPYRDSQQLALGLLIFTIGYLIFLFVLFFSNIKEAFEEFIARLH